MTAFRSLHPSSRRSALSVSVFALGALLLAVAACGPKLASTEENANSDAMESTDGGDGDGDGTGCVEEGAWGWDEGDACCTGLSAIGCQYGGTTDACVQCEGFFCTLFCSNGKCEGAENFCNCGEDCTDGP